MRLTDAGARVPADISRAARTTVAARAAVFAAVAALLVACGGGGGYSAGPSNGSGGMTGGGTGNAVSVVNNAFNPSRVTVPAGSAVTWQWNSGGVAHNVTFTDGTTSGTKSSGSYQRTFSTAGSYDYQCTIHGASMSGSVVVQ